MEAWKLTDQEITELDARSRSIHEAQEAKKQAFIEAGGVILNPDALTELYEAVKVALWDGENSEYEAQKQGKPRLIERHEMYRQALAKAEGN